VSQQIHGTVVADTPESGVLLIGPSGAGKSGLALQLMAYGCNLVADDLVDLRGEGGRLIAGAAAPLNGIEARGVGILKSVQIPDAQVVLVVDLGKTETERLPETRSITYCDVDLPLVHKFEAAHFPAAILHYMRYGRLA